jgi:predicted alpha/beta-fold hydrolase
MPLLQAEDDPIAPKNAIPYAALEANPMCTLVVTPGGGHLGWGAGPNGPFGALLLRILLWSLGDC